MAKARFGFWSRVVLGTGLVFCPVRGRADDAPIATAQELNDGGRIEILSLQRTDAGTVTLRFTVTSGRNDLGITLLNLVLIDLDGRRQYSPGLTSSACRSVARQPTVCWAMFADPGKAVRKLYVKFYEDFDLIPVSLAD